MTKSSSSPTLHYICNITVDLQDLWSRFHSQSMYNAGRQKGTLLAQRRKRLLEYIQKHSDAVLLFCFLHFRWETNTKHNWLSYKLKHCTVQNILWIVLVKNIYIYNADLFLKYTQRHRHTLTGGGPVPVKALFQWGSEAVQQISSYCDLKPAPATPSRSTETLVLVGSVQIWLDVDWHRSDWTEVHFSSEQRFSSLTPLLILQPICFFSALKTQDETRLRIERRV